MEVKRINQEILRLPASPTTVEAEEANKKKSAMVRISFFLKKEKRSTEFYNYLSRFGRASFGCTKRRLSISYKEFYTSLN